MSYPSAVSYRTPLEARLAKKVTTAIVEHRLIEDGDRVMVGLSGGKDSWALMQVLDVLRRRAPIDFSLVAVNVNSGYTGFRHAEVTAACAERGHVLGHAGRVERLGVVATACGKRDAGHENGHHRTDRVEPERGHLHLG